MEASPTSHCYPDDDKIDDYTRVTLGMHSCSSARNWHNAIDADAEKHSSENINNNVSE